MNKKCETNTSSILKKDQYLYYCARINGEVE